MPAAFQQPGCATRDGENVAVLPNQLHLGLLRTVQQFVEFGHIRHIAFQFKIVILPEMDIQLAVLNLDFALLKALTPAVAVLTGNVVAQDGLLIIEQSFFQFHGQTPAQFVAANFHRRHSTYHLAADRIVLVVILHQVAVEICNVLFHGLINSIGILQQVMTVQRATLILVVRFVLPIRFIREKVRSQRRIKFHLQIASPLSFCRTDHG